MGGPSGEHEISVRSAAAVSKALAALGHEIVAVGITKSGTWIHGDYSEILERATQSLVSVNEDFAGQRVTLAQTDGRASLRNLDAETPSEIVGVDIAFPIVHGPGGEDGKLQGLLASAGVPFVGADCTSSAVAMDKLLMKTLCAGADIRQVDFLNAADDDCDALHERIESSFGYPCFVKPANLGSSVGISCVQEKEALAGAMAEARSWDDRVIIERGIRAREIELALLGRLGSETSEPDIAPPGEIATDGGFYDFETKYVDDQAELIAPAWIADTKLETMHDIAKKVWSLIGCTGMARCDFFVEKNSGKVYFNEINTIPGFTEISMYPRLWQVAGIEMPELVDRLLQLALDRDQRGLKMG